MPDVVDKGERSGQMPAQRFFRIALVLARKRQGERSPNTFGITLAGAAS